MLLSMLNSTLYILTLLKKLFPSPLDKLKKEIIDIITSIPGDSKMLPLKKPYNSNDDILEHYKNIRNSIIKQCWEKLIPIILIEEDINIVYKLFQEKEQEIEMLEDQTYQYVLNKSSRENLTYPQYLIYKSLIDNNKTILGEVYIAFDNASKM